MWATLSSIQNYKNTKFHTYSVDTVYACVQYIQFEWSVRFNKVFSCFSLYSDLKTISRIDVAQYAWHLIWETCSKTNLYGFGFQFDIETYVVCFVFLWALLFILGWLGLVWAIYVAFMLSNCFEWKTRA